MLVFAVCANVTTHTLRSEGLSTLFHWVGGSQDALVSGSGVFTHLGALLA